MCQYFECSSIFSYIFVVELKCHENIILICKKNCGLFEVNVINILYNLFINLNNSIVLMTNSIHLMTSKYFSFNNLMFVFNTVLTSQICTSIDESRSTELKVFYYISN